MLESTDNLTQDNYSSITNNMYWQSITTNTYEECLRTFFPNGIKFNGSILYRKVYLPNATPGQPYTIYTQVGNTLEKLNIKIGLKLKIKSIFDTTIQIFINENDSIDFTLYTNGDIIPISSNLDIIEHYQYDKNSNELCIEYTPAILAEDGYKIVIGDDFLQTDILMLKEFIYRDNTLAFLSKDLPQMDSADLCGFLWYANKGRILKNKLFSGKSLIENKFSEIDFVKQINFNEHIEDKHYQNLLKNTLPGDIYVFVQNEVYHCVFIIDPIKHYYTECSSRIEHELNPFYNGKINPYDFERRIKSLAENSNLYQIRLN